MIFLCSFSNAPAQEDIFSFVRNSCGMTIPSNLETIYPLKPPVTGEHYMRIIIVYVMFNNETQLSGPNNTDQDWSVNTTDGPSWKGTMLASSKNDISDWWNAYDIGTQSISSWFCENSRGQTHVIGVEKFVKLPLTAQEYKDIYKNQKNREKAINAYIYENLTTQDIQWQDYDKWSYSTNSGWSWGADGNVDMIYKVHRYNYYEKYKEIFSADPYSGICYLGYGQSNNSDNEYDYIITQGGVEYHFSGYCPFTFISHRVGSGLTVVGNGTSGVIDKMGTLGRLMHENGHYFFGGDHSNIGMMGDAWELSYSPWEKWALGYASPYISYSENNPFEEVILNDISGRGNTGNYLLSIKRIDREFIIANRNKYSRWDRIMYGDIAHCNENTELGKGAYIYHNATYNFYYPNKNIDIECADGLWKWVQNGYDALDWSPTNYVLPVLDRIEVVRNQNDDGVMRNINEPQYQNLGKDGLTVMGEGIPPPNEPIPVLPKYFSKGKKSTDRGCGWDRIETNTDWQNWTSREFQVDRWDAWKPGYNEIFSPYSSPSTIEFSGNQTGTFIWIKEYDNQTYPYPMKIWIFRDLEHNIGGMHESEILAATPPSRPMGLKEIECYFDGSYNRPRITWTHNMEPDMERDDGNGPFKRYNIFKVKSNDMNSVPLETSYQYLTYVDIPSNQTPTFIDYTEISACYLPDNAPCPPFCWILYPIRYRVQAVDNGKQIIDDKISVKSDYAQVLGIRLESGGTGGNENDNPNGVHINNNIIPKEFNLNQNYPNPFNPVTNIKYDLPKDVFVTIKIYDLLGREIKTLVSEFKQAGSFLVSFNGSEFASGIYFYKIQAGSYTQVKRMVLIK